MQDDSRSIYDESPVALRDVYKIHPERPTLQSLYGWAKKGLLNRRTGQRVKLETYQNGKTRYTSIEALRRFTERLNEGSEADQELDWLD